THDLTQRGQRSGEGLAGVVEQQGTPAGPAMNAERQLDQVAQPLALEPGLLGEEFQVQPAGELRRLPGEEQPPEQVEHLRRFRLFEEYPEVPSLVTGVLKERREAERPQHREEPAAFGAERGAQLTGEGRLAACL